MTKAAPHGIPNVGRPDRTPAQFDAVIALLSDEERWFKPQPQYPWRPEWLAFDKDGMACLPTSPRASRWTLRGAIYLAAAYFSKETYEVRYSVGMMESAIIAVLMDLMDAPSVEGFNNHENTDHASLMALLRDARENAIAETGGS